MGTDTITATVTAEDGTTAQAYSIIVTRRAPPAQNDATLASLTVSAGTLSPAFHADSLTYTVDVENTVTQLTVTYATNHSGANAVPNKDVDAATPGAQVNLNEGSNTITVTVTAADGDTNRTYRVNVTRARDVPSAPQRLSISSPQSGRLTVKWRAPANEGGSGINRYQVRVESGNWMDAPGGYDSDGNEDASINTSLGREYRITSGLIDGRATKIQVRAVASPRGDNPSPADTASVGPPASITGTSWPHIAAVIAYAGDEDPTDDYIIDEGDTITIRVSLNTRTFFGDTRVSITVADTEKATVLGSTMTTFQPADSVQDFKVVATDNLLAATGPALTVNVTAKVEEEEAKGRTVNTTTDRVTLTINDDDTTPPNSPSITLNPGTSGVITVTWTPLAATTDAWGNAAASSRKYQLRYKLASGAATTWSEWSDNEFAATASTTTLTGLTAGSSYQVEFRAATAAGPSAQVTTATGNAGS